MSRLIWFKTVVMVFLKEVFEEIYFKKAAGDNKLTKDTENLRLIFKLFPLDFWKMQFKIFMQYISQFYFPQ